VIVAAVREPRKLAVVDRMAIALELHKSDKAAVGQILELLTGEQRKIWRNLIGETIDVLPATAWDLLGQPAGSWSPARMRPRPVAQIPPNGAIRP
jgi:hypothetical protein